MIRAASLLLALLVPVQAAALSCLPPDPVRAFKEAAASEKAFVVLYGAFRFDASKLPRGGVAIQSDPNAGAEIPARFSGKGLGREGFTIELSRGVTIDAVCWAAWCGGMAPDVPTLAFVERRGTDYIVQADPCNTRIFPNPSDAVLDKMTICMQGGPCEPEPFPFEK